MSKRLGGIIGCKDKTSSWHLIGFPDGIIATLGQQSVGEQPSVILYTYKYINFIDTILRCKLTILCECVYVCFLPIHSRRQVDVPAGVTQEEGHTGFLIHLPSAVRALIFPREKDSAIPFPRRL